MFESEGGIVNFFGVYLGYSVKTVKSLSAVDPCVLRGLVLCPGRGVKYLELLK